MGDLVAFVANYFKGTICTWTPMAGTSSDICGLGLGGLPLAIGVMILACIFGPLKNAVAKLLEQRPVAMAATVVLVAQIFYFHSLLATLLAVTLLAGLLAFSTPLARYRIVILGRSMKLNDAVMLGPPVVFILTVGIAALVQINRPVVGNATIVLIPSPRGDATASDLKNYFRQVRVNLAEQLSSFDILPSRDGIEEFPKYLHSLGYTWTELPPILDALNLSSRPSVELLRSDWQTMKFKDEIAIGLTVERRSYDPRARTYKRDVNSRSLTLYGPKDPNAAVFSLLVTYEVVSRPIAASNTDESPAARMFSDWFREFGRHLRDRVAPDVRVALDEGCKTFKCLEPVVVAYTRLLDDDFTKMRDKAAPVAERAIKTSITAMDGVVGSSP